MSNLSMIAHDECGFHYVTKSRLVGGLPVTLLHRSFNIGLYSISPVSYTHLDVYKRQEVDFESCRIGFRRVEISPEGVVLLNGKRLIIRGVDLSLIHI